MDNYFRKLVLVVKDQPVTTSLAVARVFGKNHRDVTRKIRNLGAQNCAAQNYYYKAYREYHGQKFPYYYMNKDGFSLLVMGFTGQIATTFKIEYIQAFDYMYKKLSETNPVKSISNAPKSKILLLASKYARKAEKNQSKADRYDKTISVPNTYSATIVAKDLGIGACTMNAYLNAWHIIYRQNGSWVLYSRYSGKGYAKYRYYDNVHAKPLLRWTQKGRQFILDQFKQHLNKKFLN